jgi:hypothetical protein
MYSVTCLNLVVPKMEVRQEVLHRLLKYRIHSVRLYPKHKRKERNYKRKSTSVKRKDIFEELYVFYFRTLKDF